MPGRYVGTMPSGQVEQSEDVLEFLRREAPTEFARLRSIAQVLELRDSGDDRSDDLDGDSHTAWMREMFDAFRSAPAVDSAA